MKYRTRTFYSETQKALMWERWREGESLHAIAQMFDRNHTSVRHILARAGGIRPPARTRAARALALAEREEISRGVTAGQSVRAIARLLRRAPSTVSREIHRNGGPCSYRASVADQAAWGRAQRPKPCKLARNRALARAVAEKLRLEWSPYQVAGWLKRTYPQDETRQVSHETIYRTLFIQARGALKKELLQHLRRTRGMRRSRHHTQKSPNHGRITETVSIRERPAEAEDRAVPGHWEGDLFFGSHNSQIATLVERQTRYLMLVKAPGKDTETVVDALIKQAHKLPRELYKSLTWDRGKGRFQPVDATPCAAMLLLESRRDFPKRTGGRLESGCDCKQIRDHERLRQCRWPMNLAQERAIRSEAATAQPIGSQAARLHAMRSVR
jgi:IS30 family transposase